MRLSIMQAAIGHRHIAGGGDKPVPSGYRGGTGSSVGIGGAIAVHALVIGAWLLIPKEVIDTVKASGLRGRGGAGFPAGLKWSFIPQDTGKPIYLVCNADESEPGTFKDRLLMEHDPHLVVESTMLSGYAMQTDICFIYIRGEYVQATKMLERAIAEAYDKGYIGKNILGSGWNCELVLHRGAGAYICGEETALMSSLEGDRGYPRFKPPFPAVSGVWGMPTTINNTETMACVPFIVERGAEWFSRIGKDEKNSGPKLYCLSGHVKRPGVYEEDMGFPLMELIHGLGGGMLHDDRPLKACVPGGISVPVLRAEDCEVDLDFDSLSKKGSALGSAGIMIMDSSTCMVEALLRTTHFFAQSRGRNTRKPPLAHRFGPHGTSRRSRSRSNAITARRICVGQRIARFSV